ncbi:hypothetical protein SDRG_02232 [Saprolegnia diclina VS20]|uniref:F-box domain-containing protein n=1 Tax=Saprolegnia diclina (strain VS20) TaxID=1156394 RepID=T0R046_SAPDV|nr:hypothetical protein SDRG_02232 [Saprolegnia diclina VS20]EQC40331.1 hypothetical protein SDRG_02232 [Saprolegnia diclina VS20]|eukprot:XP_008606030.1 hypothetical protein SDRG_02232 [Saprolegnia diclina VS20]
MTTDNRPTPWLLLASPIALQILDYLDDSFDACAFLQAAPDGSLDDALDALRTLLAMDLDSLDELWPRADIAPLDEAYRHDPSVVARALPLIKKIDLGFCRNSSSICHATALPPTTAVSAYIDLDDISVRTLLGKWLPNLVDLKVVSQNERNVARIVQNDLSACHGLRALTLAQHAKITQGTFTDVLSAVVAQCPYVERIGFESTKLSLMSNGKALLAWLTRSHAHRLELHHIDFHDELCDELATALLTSTSLETIVLSGGPSLTRAMFSPSSPPLPQQLRHLTIFDYLHEYDSSSYAMAYDWDYRAPVFFLHGALGALAAKIAASRLETLELGPHYPTNLTSVVNILPSLKTLTKLRLQETQLTAFPPLRQLLHLEMTRMYVTDEAFASLTTLLGSSPDLVHLDLDFDGRTFWSLPPDDDVETMLRAMAHWLSHRGADCNVRLNIKTDASATALVAALAQTRSSHEITFSIGAYGISLDVKEQLVAALASSASSQSHVSSSSLYTSGLGLINES